MYLSRQSKEEQIKEEALLAAQKLFQQFGLRKTTMEDIAKVMGKGKSTLYYYYKSKEEIFNDVIMREIDEVFNKTRSEIEKITSAEEKLKTYFSVSTRTIKQKVILYKIIQGEVFEKLSPVDLFIKKFNTREIQSAKEILLLGIKNKEFPVFF